MFYSTAEWHEVIELYNDGVDDMDISMGEEEIKVMVTQLVRRERWMKILVENEETLNWDTILVMKFERRELREALELLAYANEESDEVTNDGIASEVSRSCDSEEDASQ
jgi:hypothetical protein